MILEIPVIRAQQATQGYKEILATPVIKAQQATRGYKEILATQAYRVLLVTLD